MKGFGSMAKEAMKEGALTALEKELIALPSACRRRCDGCIGFHVKALIRLGVTREQLMETLGICTYMGGGPSLMYAAEAVRALRRVHRPHCKTCIKSWISGPQLYIMPALRAGKVAVVECAGLEIR